MQTGNRRPHSPHHSRSGSPVSLLLCFTYFLVKRVSLRKTVVMVLVLAALTAACAAIWLSQGFLCMLLALPLLGALYLIVFHTRWCYVALMTAPRDLR